MNIHGVLATFVATIAATLALTSTAAMAAKPGGGEATDTCATAGLDFPAFAYWKPSGKGIEILVADATGKCSRSVIKSSGTGPTIEFSYPVVGADGVTRGRVVWVHAPAVVAVDFTVAAGTNQIAVGPRRTLYPQTGGYISLSRDGHTLYTNNYLDSGETVINRLPLDPLGTPTPVFTEADSVSATTSISVNGDETLLFADYITHSGGSTLNQLVWIPLDGTNQIHVIDSNNRQEELSPAVDPGSSSNRVAYSNFVASNSGCSALLTSDVSGNPTAPAQPAYGKKPTWVNGMILADGLAPSTRSGCWYTGTIMQTHPDTGVQTALVSGRDPDGK